MKLDFRLGERAADRCAWLFIVTYILIFCYICFLKFTSFSYGDFDLAVDEQFLWSVGRAPLYNSILGAHFFGNHLHFILFFLVPFYKLYPHTVTLLWFQTALLGVSAWPVYLLAKRLLSFRWALFITFSYLFYPPLAYINLFEFHPAAFSIIFMLTMLYFYYTERFAPFVISMVLALLCQENIPLGIAAFGIYSCVLRRSKRWILTPLISGILYFLLAVKVLLPFFNKHAMQFLLLYNHLGHSYSEIVSNIILHPMEILAFMFQPHKLYYLIQLFGPLAFVPLLSPAALIPAMPFFMQHLLSNRVNEVTIYFHYTAEVIPFIFVAFIFGLKRLLSFNLFKKKYKIISICLCGIMVWGSLWLGPHFSFPKLVAGEWYKDNKDRIKELFINEIPSKSSVVATFEFLPFLTYRRGLYSFHHVYWGFYTMSTKPYVLPEDANVALIDFSDKLTFSPRGFFSPRGYENIQNFLKSGQWGVVDALDSIVLLNKGAKGTGPLYEVLSAPPQPQVRVDAVVDNSLELLGYDVQDLGNKFKVVFYWHCLCPMKKDISLFYHLVDNKGKILYESFIPLCYGIYPSYAWKEGEYVSETKFLPFAYEVRVFGAKWKLGFYDFLTGEGYPVNDRDVFGRIDLKIAK